MGKKTGIASIRMKTTLDLCHNEESSLLCFDKNGRFVCCRGQLSISKHKLLTPKVFSFARTANSSEVFGRLTYIDKVKMLIQASKVGQDGVVLELPWNSLCLPQMISAAEQCFELRFRDTEIRSKSANEIGSFLAAKCRKSDKFQQAGGVPSKFQFASFDFAVVDILSNIGYSALNTDFEVNSAQANPGTYPGTYPAPTSTTSEESEPTTSAALGKAAQKKAAAEKAALTKVKISNSDTPNKTTAVVVQPSALEKATLEKTAQESFMDTSNDISAATVNSSEGGASIEITHSPSVSDSSDISYDSHDRETAPVDTAPGFYIEVTDNFALTPAAKHKKQHVIMENNTKCCSKCTLKCTNETLVCGLCKLEVHFKCYPSQRVADSKGGSAQHKAMAQSTFNGISKCSNIHWLCNECEDPETLTNAMAIATVKIQRKVSEIVTVASEDIDTVTKLLSNAESEAETAETRKRSKEKKETPLSQIMSVNEELVLKTLPPQKKYIKNDMCNKCGSNCKNETLKCFVCKRKVHYSCHKTQGSKPMTAQIFNTSLDLVNHKWTCRGCKHTTIDDIMAWATKIVSENIRKSCDFLGDINSDKIPQPDGEQVELTEESCNIDSSGTANNYSLISNGSITVDGYVSAPETSPGLEGYNRRVSLEKNKWIENAKRQPIHNYTPQNERLCAEIRNAVAEELSGIKDNLMQFFSSSTGLRSREALNSTPPMYSQLTSKTNTGPKHPRVNVPRADYTGEITSTEPNPEHKRNLDPKLSIIIRKVQSKKFASHDSYLKAEFNKHFENMKISHCKRTRYGNILIELTSEDDVTTVIDEWQPSFFTNNTTGDQATEVLRMNSSRPKHYAGVIRHAAKELANLDIEHALKEEGYTEPKATRFVKQGNPLNTVMLTFSTEEEFNTATRHGVIIGRRHFPLYSYSPTKRPMQCFKCNKFGHPIKWCRSNRKCGYCSSTEHDDNDCPHQGNQDRHYCSNCNGGHSSRSHTCPIYQQTMTLITQHNRHE
jgi:hypothetical protein